MKPPHIEEAYQRAWAVLHGRSADHKAVQNRLARLIVTFARTHPKASPEEVATSVLRFFGERNGGERSG
jgi:hypothetical protein